MRADSILVGAFVVEENPGVREGFWKNEIGDPAQMQRVIHIKPRTEWAKQFL